MVNWDVIVDNAIAGIIAGTIGGLIAAVLLKLFSLVTRPKLEIKFEPDDTYTVAYVEQNSQRREFLFVHLNICNKSKAIAQGCKVFLLKLEQKIDNQFEEVPINTHLTLKWANETEENGFKGLEIPGEYRRRVDLAHGLHRNNQIFTLFIEGGPRGVPNGFSQGEYRFTIQTSGINTNTVTKKFILKWNKTFERDNIEVEKEK